MEALGLIIVMVLFGKQGCLWEQADVYSELPYHGGVSGPIVILWLVFGISTVSKWKGHSRLPVEPPWLLEELPRVNRGNFRVEARRSSW